MNDEIKKAVEVLKNGGIVIFPTDTAFGIGCRIDDQKAVKRLFKIRERPLTQAVPVLVDSIEMVKKYTREIPKEVINQLIKFYWPGALTIILQSRTDKVPELVRGGGSTIGVRMPNHPIARKLIRGVGLPILGPSANFHGERTPYKFEDLSQALIKKVDFVVNGECFFNKESTVIDCSIKPWKIIRQGAIKIKNQFCNAESKIKNQSYEKEKTTLIIDTSERSETRVGLRIRGKSYWVKRKMGIQKSQVILPMIEKIFKKHGLSTDSLEKIEVNTRSDSFTGVRVGIAIANALSYSLKIPVNNTLEGFAEPVYD